MAMFLYNEDITNDELRRFFEQGKIPLRFDGIWNDVVESLSEQIELSKLTKAKLLTFKEKANDVSEKIVQLHTEIAQKQQALEILHEKKLQWEENISLIEAEKDPFLNYNESQCDKIISFSSRLSKMEQALSSEVLEKLADNPEEFSSLSSTEGNTRLSLAFNAIGLSEETIHKLKDLDGLTFLATEEFLDHQFKNIQERLDLQYFRKLIEERYFDIVDHKKKCVVCSCSTPNELIEFLQNYQMDLIDNDIWRRFQINGPRLLGATVGDFYYHFKLSPNHKNLAVKIRFFLQKIHKGQ